MLYRGRGMTVNLTRIYTRLGDGGETHLGDMSRVPKTHARIEAYGTVDELNAQLGVALAQGGLPERFVPWIQRVQNDLFDVGADISVPHGGDRARLRLAADQTAWLERPATRSTPSCPTSSRSCCPAARRGRAAARLPHGLPARRAAHDRLRRRGQRRVRALPEPPVGPAVHPLARRERGRAATASRCGSRADSSKRSGAVPRRAPRAAGALRVRAPARRPLGQARRQARDPPRGARPRRRGVQGAARRAGRAHRRLRAARRAGGDRRRRMVSRARGASDLFFERNQAVRAAVVDVQHVTTLLGYLAEPGRSALRRRARRVAARLGDEAAGDRERHARRRGRGGREPRAGDRAYDSPSSAAPATRSRSSSARSARPRRPRR